MLLYLLQKKQPKFGNILIIFQKIHFIKGSPLLGEDLFRANINSADKTVVLGWDIENRNTIL